MISVLIFLYEAFRQGSNVTEIFTLKTVSDVQESSDGSGEKNLLENNKRRIERALNRLKALYMYSDSDMSETEYSVERKKLLDELERINSRLNHLEELSSRSMLGSDDWMEQASYFVLTQELMSKRSISYETLLRAVDSKIIKNFVNSTVQNFCILDGKIASITFKSGISHKFLYEDQQQKKS